MSLATHLRQSTGSGKRGSGKGLLYAQDSSPVLWMVPLEEDGRGFITRLGVAKVEENAGKRNLQAPFLPAAKCVLKYITAPNPGEARRGTCNIKGAGRGAMQRAARRGSRQVCRD